MNPRLPIPGSDDGNWGDILNSFLEVSLASDGTLNSNIVGTTQLEANSVTSSQIASGAVGTTELANNAVTNSQLDSPTQTTLASVAGKYTLPNGGVPSSDMSSAVQSNLTSASTAVQPSTTLSGDLSGTLSSPTVAKIKGIALPSSSPSSGQVLQATSNTATNWATVTSSGSVNNATTSAPGLIELSGDLGGTATAPTVTTSGGIPIVTTTATQTLTNKSISGGQITSAVANATAAVTANSATSATTATNATNSTNATTASAANALNSSTTSVVVNGANAPTSGQVLTATGSTAAAWATPASGGNSSNASSIDGVTVTGTPSANQVLTASSSTAAGWSTPSGGSSASNATTSTPGLVELSGDLGGTATAPTVTTTHLTSALPLTQGGTGSTTQNFVDLSTAQTIAGTKNFTGGLTVNGQSINSSPTYQAYKSASYTLQLSDADTIVPFVAGTLCTLTVPSNANVAFPLGTVIYIENNYCTQVNIATQSGVSFIGERISLPGGTVVMLLKQATDTWILSSVNNNQRVATNRYYPEDYGLVGGSNDTPAVQAAIDAAAANGGGTIVLRGQGYTLSSSPRTDRGGYSVLALPNTNSGVISFSGVKGLTVFNCSLSGQAYSSTYGVPSVIGGPTPEQNSNNSQYKINWYVNMEGITVSVTNNPTYSGIDLYCMTKANLSDVHVTMGGYGAQPTSVYSFGVRMPGSDNYGVANLTNVLVDGFYFGYVIYQSHAILYQTISNLCYVAYGLIAGGDTHATTGTGVQWQECKYGITGYSTSGIVSLVSAFYISLPLLDLEDGTTGQWYSSPIHVVDANNMIHGEINYSRTTAAIGGDVGALTVSGATNLTMHDLNANSIYATPSMSSNWNAVTSVGSTTTLIPLRYKKDRSGLVRLEGTFSKSSVALSSGEVAFTLPAGFRPSGGLYFTTVTDSGTGAIKYDGQNPGNFVWISGGSITSGTGFMTISAIYEGLA